MKLSFGTRCLFFTLQEHESVPSWISVVEVYNDVPLRDPEIAEEVPNFTHSNRVRQATHLQCLVLVAWVHEIGEPHRLASAVAAATTTATVASFTIAATTATASSSAATTASGATTTVASVVSFLELILLVVLKVVVLFFWDHDEVDPARADMLLVFVLVGLLAVFRGLKEARSLAGKFSIGHGTNFDGIFYEPKAVEEFEDVIFGDGVGEAFELHGPSVGSIVLFVHAQIFSVRLSYFLLTILWVLLLVSVVSAQLGSLTSFVRDSISLINEYKS